MFKLNGRNVAGMGPVMDASQRPAWMTYVATDDADGVAARATEAGGSVLFDPMDVTGAGRMVIVAHPAGGVIGAWQAGSHTGAQLVNEPGALNWNELQTRDVEGAKAFYAAVFGWQPDDQEFGGMTYTMFNVGDIAVAGAMPTPSGVPAGVPAFWLSYFSVENCDASMATVQELGGTLMGHAHQLEGVGRFAVVADPHGATFGVIAGEPPEE
jgi:predicted enzyme related to lactoylglutathione lyase